jgi:hypothetical protein
MNAASLIVLTAVISSLGGLALGLGAALLWRGHRSRWYRHNFEIPSILGRWRCRWYDDELPQDEPRVEDVMEIDRWIADGEFIARGIQEQRNLVFPLIGEIDPSRIVTLTYKAARYPYEPNRGVVLLELSRDGQTMHGKWFGRRFSGRLGGGRVVCARITDDGVTSAA